MTKKNWGRDEGTSVFLRRPDGHIYLAKRIAKNRPFAGLYAAPGGTVEEGESPVLAAVREVKEETGLEIDFSRMFFLSRTGPYVTKPENQGSGTPYHMSYFGVELQEGEVPKVTEPTKQGEWEARSWAAWVLGANLCPGTDNALELLHERAVLAFKAGS